MSKELELEDCKREARAIMMKVAPHFDGPGVPRRADDAMRAVTRERTAGDESGGPE